MGTGDKEAAEGDAVEIRYRVIRAVGITLGEVRQVSANFERPVLGCIEADCLQLSKYSFSNIFRGRQNF